LFADIGRRQKNSDHSRGSEGPCHAYYALRRGLGMGSQGGLFGLRRNRQDSNMMAGLIFSPTPGPFSWGGRLYDHPGRVAQTAFFFLRWSAREATFVKSSRVEGAKPAPCRKATSNDGRVGQKRKLEPAVYQRRWPCKNCRRSPPKRSRIERLKLYPEP